MGVSAEISQITDAPGLDGGVNLFLYLLEKWTYGVNSSYTFFDTLNQVSIYMESILCK